MTPAQKLIALRDAINRALPLAYADESLRPHEQRLFASREGIALVHAAFDLFECPELYDMAGDVERDVIPTLKPVTIKTVRPDPAIWGKGAVG